MIAAKGTPDPVQDSISSLLPDAATALEAMERTWPARRCRDLRGWTLRLDPGAGKRVTAATARAPGGDIAAAESAMRAAGQTPLFMLRPDQRALDAALDARGYRRVDPVTIHAAPVAALAATDPRHRVCQCDFPLTVMAELWAAGGIGPARLAVMARAARPRCWLLARADHQPAGVAFVAAWRGLAMVHAVEVPPALRRQGHARRLLAAAARWAQGHGAGTLALAVTDANAPANALYAALGMRPVARYHYRQAAE
ncbi:GNAT family N-acetyltransferase [Rhodobacteraceae bacterium 2CG4]|uniref:GNAT family N-acetyltransferase n=2 Tax=Halovulum marinum TaxID=2662447 RepID=A0A6L5YYW5_9RHOB|nr:GNAT family N-acetyltransferase [Halovulum marinum]